MQKGVVTMEKPIVVGRTYRFKYPAEFTTMPEYTAHSGQLVTVQREAREGIEYDYEGDKAYYVKASDGWTGFAFSSELVGWDK